MAQFYQILNSDLLCPQNLDNVHVVSLSDDSTLNQQQVILSPDEPIILNEGQLQHLVYQTTRNTQGGQTQFVIQQQDDDNQVSVPQQQFTVYSEVPVENDQLLQPQLVQQTQPQQLVIRHVTSPQSPHIILQKVSKQTDRRPTQQLLVQPALTTQNPTQHLMVHQPQQQVIVQQQSQTQQDSSQTQNTGQVQVSQQSTNIVVRGTQITTNAIGTPRIIYTHQGRNILLNTQQQDTQQSDVRVLQTPQRQQHNVVVTPQSPAQLHNLIIQRQPTQNQNQGNSPNTQTNLPTTQIIATPQTPQQNVANRFQTIVRATVPRMPNITNNRSTYRPLVTFPASNIPAKTDLTQITPTATPRPRGRAPSARGRGGRNQPRLSTPSPARTPTPTTSPNETTQVAQVITTQNVTARPRASQPSNQPVTQKIFSSPQLSITSSSTPQQRTSQSQIQRVVGTPQSQIQRVVGTPQAIQSNVSNTPPTTIQQPKYRSLPINKQNLTDFHAGNDLEESIQVAVLPRNPEKNSSTNATSSDATKPFSTTLTTYYTDGPDDDKETIKLTNGRVMPLSEYKKIQKQQQLQQQQQQQQQQQSTVHSALPKTIALLKPTLSQTGSRLSATGNAIISPTNAGNKVIATKTAVSIDESPKLNRQQLQPQRIIHGSHNTLPMQEGDSQKSARMLVLLSSGEQRLITFTLPEESCTVEEILKQVGVPFTSKTSIQCHLYRGANIDYVVTVGIPPTELTTELLLNAEKAFSRTQEAAAAQNALQQSSSLPTTPHGQQSIEKAQSGETAKEPPPKLIPGFLAVCSSCGYTGSDHAKCERCRRTFHELPKRVPTLKAPLSKMDEDKKKQDVIGRGVSPRAFATVTTSRGRAYLTTPVRGRGRGTGRAKPAEAEPIILTLSSDEEGDEEKSNSSQKESPPSTSPNLSNSPLPCEPNYAEILSSLERFYSERELEFIDDTKSQAIISCKAIRIGTHEYEPKEPVKFSVKGIRIVAPNVKNLMENVVLNLELRDIVKVIAHFPKPLSVIFIYTLPTVGKSIRESLDMDSKAEPDNKVPFYNPTDRNEPYKRIVLLMENVTDETKNVIRSMFPQSVLEEIAYNDAHELCQRSSKDKINSRSDLLPSSTQSPEPGIRQILIYPPGTGGISINTEDYMCLAIDQYLNDVIIDFYLKYLHIHMLTEEQREKTHIFSSFFYKRLTTMSSRQRQSEKDVKLTAAQKRHARVKNWTKNVNIFEKDFIIIPINEQSHWFLAIICFPMLEGPVTFETFQPVLPEQAITKRKKACGEKINVPTQIGDTTITRLKRDIDSVCIPDDSMSERDEAEGDESDLATDDSESEACDDTDKNVEKPEPIKQPTILIFDSLAGASRSRVVATLRDYLTCEYKIKIKDDDSNRTFNKTNMPGHCVKVPQQNNFTDCGLYLLQYVEQFFKDPIIDYRLPIKQLVNWFETIVVTRKREDISNLLRGLIDQHNPGQRPLPEIAFPTVNGNLVDIDDSFHDEPEFEEEELEDEMGDEEEDEHKSNVGDNEADSSIEKIQNGSMKREFKRTIDEIVDKSSDVRSRKNARIDNTI